MSKFIKYTNRSRKLRQDLLVYFINLDFFPLRNSKICLLCSFLPFFVIWNYCVGCYSWAVPQTSIGLSEKGC